MIESKILKEWTAQAVDAATKKATTRTQIDMVLKALRTRFQKLPADVVAAVQAGDDSAKFDRWMEQAILAPTLDDFRKALTEP